MLDELNAARDGALDRIAQARTVGEIDAIDAEVLGKKGSFATAKQALGRLATVDEKKTAGQALNTATQAVAAALAARRAELARAERSEQLLAERYDLTEELTQPSRGHAHLVTQAWQRLEDVFIGLGFQVAEGPEVETDFYNFEALNMPRSHPARSGFDTLFTDYHGPLAEDGTVLLRTHTSPVQARVMQHRRPPIRIIAPGRVYRNETISTRSHAQFHQVEGLYIDEGVSFADLKQTLLFFAQEMFGAPKIRLRPSFFPFTEPSAEMDIWLGTDTEKNYRLTNGTGWLEILGCGMVDPQVLENCGIDSQKYSGYAFGMGIERQALRLYEIGDIRLLFENDVRFLRQFASAM